MRTAMLLLAVAAAAGCPDLHPTPTDPRFTPGIAGPIGGNRLPEPAALPEPTDGKPGEYSFCFWNVENLFDDRDDARTKRGDTTYDAYFSQEPEALKWKLRKLTDVLVRMNGGKGPDILCLAEVEVNSQAPRLLLDAYNARTGDPSRHLLSVLFDNPGGGRDIGCAVLTRLPVDRDRTQLLGRRLRILEGRIVVNDHPLVVVASHWSSRISDKDGGSRSTYGDVIYGRFRAMASSNPAVDFLVCGDFNDPPEEESVVTHLHAIGDLQRVRAGGPEPALYNLMTPLAEKGLGTHYYRRWWLFDHICVSPGLLDNKGWSVVPGSAGIVPEVASKGGQPDRFGGPGDKRPYSRRGAADHFPVVCKLRVAGAP
ncbi:MAG: endonuclease/exonuclease/phosphatase family protein [Gemmataceae bacterium]